MNRFISFVVFGGLLVASPMMAQGNDPEPGGSETTLRITSRAVLVDVTVTDHDGKPVTGLRQDAFSVSEQGKPQLISFFEEHNGAEKAKQDQQAEFPTLPPDVFSNFSPIAPPAALNVLLLDSLNTPMEDQMMVREQARNYLKTLKPGSRIAIFTMSLRLSFVQGFADDPVLLATALGYRKNAKPEPAILLQSQEEANAQSNVVGMMAAAEGGGGPGGTTSAAPAGMISALQSFLQETQYAQTSDREYRTLQDLQQLATFLGGFSGRKNMIWLSGDFPLALFGATDMRFEADVKKTINLLNAARVSIYPIDAHGVVGNALYTAQNQMDPSISQSSQLLGPPAGMAAGSPNAGQGGFSTSLSNENRDLNSSHSTMEMLARETGGQAFHNSNKLSDAINRVVTSSANFYTLSYAPTDEKMDGALRAIDVKVEGGKYNLSFRRGYYALDADLPGAAQTMQRQALLKQGMQDPTLVDPLRPFMEFGMPQTEQILYKALIHPLPEKPDTPAGGRAAGKGPQARYSVDFSVDLKDLNLKLDPEGNRDGTLNVSLIVYDKYGTTANRKDHIVQLKVKPDIYKIFQQTGVQLHAEIEVPKGQFWLRTGVYDEASHKAGTMEIPLSSVKPLETASK